MSTTGRDPIPTKGFCNSSRFNSKNQSLSSLSFSRRLRSAEDESFRRPGSMPFKWEIQPGISKPQHGSATMAPSSPPAAPAKLSPPPRMTAPSASPSPSLSKARSQSSYNGYSSMLGPPPSIVATSIFHRSASASPSRRRGHVA
ncbi:hypothetical protein Cni_G14170 [Canna indica]|uniref:Uncharacterized protein n=1 Tax=Canna indica TaxID=4628 RepID=A0AAQ3KH92_9LILI|nr:hypothetical protein Cni_G14170 [Canna indica]